MLSEIRIESLGAISVATAEFDRGLTVLTGETGTGKTMVVTGLHLLGGARADANRVRSGADRAVVEGRFTTADLDEKAAALIDEMLDASGAERDEDGSIIALRSVSRDGPSRAYLGGRSVPAKSLSGFTTELLTLHGQNDQLRLMRPDEQRGALDRFAAVGARLERYRKLRDAWQSARRDLVDRSNRARELAQEADRLKFALHEIDTVDPAPGEDDALIADIRRLSELDALREAAAGARGALSGAGEDAPADLTGLPASAADGLARAKTALESTDDATLRGLADQLGEALTVVDDAARELGGYLSELPADASTLDAKLARQAELRTLTRKYAADIDGVLQWARECARSAGSLGCFRRGAGRPATSRRRTGDPISRCGNRTQQGRAAKPPSDWPRKSPASCPAWRWPTPSSPSPCTTMPAAARRSRRADAALRRAGPRRRRRCRPGRVRLRRASRYDGAAAGKERVRRRAVAGDAGPGSGTGGVDGGHHDGVRRGRRRRRRPGGGADRAAAGAVGPQPPSHRGDASAAGRGLRRRAPHGR